MQCWRATLRFDSGGTLDSSLFWTSLFALLSLIKVSRSTDLGSAVAKAVEGVGMSMRSKRRLGRSSSRAWSRRKTTTGSTIPSSNYRDGGARYVFVSPLAFSQ